MYNDKFFYTENFYKKKKKILFSKKNTNFLIYKSKNEIYILKKQQDPIENFKSFSYVILLNLYINLYFKKQNYIKYFNVKKLTFIKNRKMLIDNVHIKYIKSWNLLNKTLKKVFFKKFFYTKILFWYKYKTPDLTKAKKKLKQDLQIEKYQNAIASEKNIIDIDF